MLPLREAIDRMMGAFEPRGAERVPLSEALARFTTEGLRARADLPPFDNSAMDGYAVRASELEGASPEAPVRLPVRGESRAGGPWPEPLTERSAMRIFTGAPMPAGADAIVIQEDTTLEGSDVYLQVAPRPGAHVRAQASDLASGAEALPAGSRLGPGEIALLASQHHGTVSVHRRPVVAILSTGDELRDASDPPEPGTIVNTNALSLAAQVTDAGGIPRILPTARDDVDDIAGRLEEALEADVVLSCGGVSVGAYDFVHEAFERCGVRADFWKVRIKPGKPIAFGTARGVPVVGLPGNPISTMVTFEIFVRPGLRRMLGDPAPHPQPLQVALSDAHRRKPGRTEFARATLSRQEGGRWVAHLHPLQGSGSLPSMVGVDALLVLPADRDAFGAGETLDALPIRPLGGAESPFPPE